MVICTAVYSPLNLQTQLRISCVSPEKIVLVQDNLNTHTPASLYEAFPAEKAMRLKERIEWHYCFAPPLGAHRCAAACGWLPRPSVLLTPSTLSREGLPG